MNLYQPLDFFILRAPLLPVENYRGLSLNPGSASSNGSNSAETGTIRRALAVGSLTLLDAVSPSRHHHSKASKVHSKLLRYLIRMSTRPTPFGLFAGATLGAWGERTDLELSTAPRRQRTRPDMDWLMRVVMKLESDPEIRRHLRLVANPCALTRGGRIFLAERVTRGGTAPPTPVSIRATGVASRALDAAREPVPFAALMSVLLESTPGATAERVERLLTELWDQTLLLTDLRPPLTVERPAEYVIDRLANIPAAAGIRSQIKASLDAAAAWDAAQQDEGEGRYRAMVSSAGKIAPFERSPFQVDSAIDLAVTGRSLSRLVGEEMARAAELLLRVSPQPHGPAHLSAYRRAFEQRYGVRREVPVLELLDSNFGLGPPLTSGAHISAAFGISQSKSAERNQTLMDLALRALRDATLSVDLDERTLARIETSDLSSMLHPSLELYASVAAASPEAIDAGEFRVVVAPNVGSQSAGRTLGRFTDLVEGARPAIEQAAALEEAHAPDKLWVELAYQPRLFRLANVSIRPNVRQHEIALGVSPGGEGARTVPLDELVVGIRDDRFYLRWPAAGQDVVITSGHMLNYLKAPAVCRFLAEVSRDGCCQLAGFQWGVASHFPVLPRIQVGRVVLSLAQWRLSAATADGLASRDSTVFLEALDRWRERWRVPQHVYLSSGDNRLLLDLTVADQADELRRAILALRDPSAVILTEVLPGLSEAWVRDSDNRHFMTEIVVPLVLRRQTTAGGTKDVAHAGFHNKGGAPPFSSSIHARPPGTEWLFVKLYGGRGLEDDLIAGPVRDLAANATSSGLADEWFFLRYGDPERHVRIRFRGRPERLMQDLLPLVCASATELIEKGGCRRFAVDTYEREIERFGGEEALSAAETLFTGDSQVVADLLDAMQTRRVTLAPQTLAVLTVDALLEGLGLDAKARFEWCRLQVRSRQEGGIEYRQQKSLLRPLLAGPDRVGAWSDGTSAVTEALTRLRESGDRLRGQLAALEVSGQLTRPVSELYQVFVHLHLNRLLGADFAQEQRVLGLLWRMREGLYRSRA